MVSQADKTDDKQGPSVALYLTTEQETVVLVPNMSYEEATIVVRSAQRGIDGLAKQMGFKPQRVGKMRARLALIAVRAGLRMLPPGRQKDALYALLHNWALTKLLPTSVELPSLLVRDNPVSPA